MRLSQSDVVPVLTIIVGGAIGLSLSAGILMPSLLLESRSDVVPSPDPVVAPSPIAEPSTPVRVRVHVRVPAPVQTGKITGQVIDEPTGLPVAAVQVFISSLRVGGLTQQNGRYLLQNVPAGTHTLTVARIGYGTTEVQIAVAGDRTLEQNFVISEEDLSRAPYPYRFAPTVRSVRPSRD